MALVEVKKARNYLFINTTPAAANPSWARVGLSTDWTETMNASTETYDFIEDESPTDVLRSYKPSASMPHHARIGDPAYDYVFELYRKQAVGSDAVTQMMKVYQQKDATSGDNLALSAEALIVIDNYNIATSILTYTVTQRGTPTHGTAKVEDGVPVFTADTEPVEP